MKILEKKNKDFKIIEYLIEGISSDQIKTIISLPWPKSMRWGSLKKGWAVTSISSKVLNLVLS